MFVGNLWILAKSRFAKARQFSGVEVARVREIPIRGVKLFTELPVIWEDRGGPRKDSETSTPETIEDQAVKGQVP